MPPLQSRRPIDNPPADALRDVIRQDTAALWRTRLRLARRNLGATARAEASAAIVAHLRQHLPRPGVVIGSFWPLAEEPDLRPLLSGWAQAGVRVALPRMRGPHQPLDFHHWDPAVAFDAGPFGVQEPPANAPRCLPTWLLVPLLGYSPQGARLGYGGGFYDRTLAELRAAGQATLCIGIAFGCAVLPEDYQPEPHDEPLDVVVTEAGWQPLRAPAR